MMTGMIPLILTGLLRMLRTRQSLVRENLALRHLSLTLNPSRCSEDWLRPFVRGSEGHPAWTNVFRVEFQTQGGGRPRRTALTGRPATSARRVHAAAGRILRRLACVAMMEAADDGRLDPWMTPLTWLDAHGRRPPTLACWTCGREVALTLARVSPI
jgi:hypothetical protein